MGIIVKKSIGKAIHRNKVKRRLREIWRLEGTRLLTGSDVVIIARQGILEATFTELKEELIGLLQINNSKRYCSESSRLT